MQVRTIQFGLIGMLLFSLFTTGSFSQDRPAVDTIAKPQAPSAVKPYKDVVTARAKTLNGFFKVHKTDDRYLFEIPKKLMGRQILAQARISKGAVDPDLMTPVPGGFGVHKTGNANDKITENIIEFANGPKNKLFLKLGYYGEQSNDFSENGMGKAVKNNSIQPLAASFDIKAYTPDSSAVVIDLTDFINGDNSLFFFSNDAKKQFGISAIAADRSYINEVKAFPINIEIETLKTYKSNDGFNTYELATSLVLLPESKMRVRYAEKRVSYYTTSIQDFDINPMGVDETNFIHRWRMEPKEEDMEKYKRGELVEPKKPIIIYIDPVTPKKWVPYFIAGVNEWQVAFEKAGFKNAIMAKEAPVSDTTWGIENASYSAIIYKAAAVPDAREQKSYTVNPQTGEILETHIIWNHSQMENLYLNYFLKCSNVNPKARAPKFDDALMGSLIQAEITHQVGHSLGLAHNYFASSTIDVEKLRNKNWVEANGISPSVMDILSYNYVAQPEDNIDPKGLLPKIGDYDKWAIEYGYRIFPEAKKPSDETAVLNKWIIGSLAKNPMLNKGTASATDPRVQSDDLGNNIMKSNSYGIKNLKAILPNLEEWTKESNKGYTLFNQAFRGLIKQYFTYIMQASPYFGGLGITSKTVEQPGAVFYFVNKTQQKEALAFVNENFFITPKWLFNKNYFELAGGYPAQMDFSRLQANLFSDILDNEKLYHLEISNLPKEENYTVYEYLTDLKNYVFAELAGKKPIDQVKRSLQKVLITALSNKITPGASISMGQGLPSINLNISNTSESYLAIKETFRSLLATINIAKTSYTDKDSKAHLIDIADRIAIALKATKE
jgi:Met-zincin/Domain of unknown function (DUF5117)/Domain of unknown function (DUF5118)